MKLCRSQINLGYTAAFLGVLQGTIWVILSVICIILYHGTRPVYTNYLDYYSVSLFHRYLDRFFDEFIFIQFYNFIITPNIFYIFAYIYLFVDFAWVIVSIVLFYGIKNAKNNLLNRMKAWIGIASFVWIFDLTFAILLGVDYDRCMKHAGLSWDFEEQFIEERECVNLSIPVIAIIFKGFTLYIVNLIFIYIMYRMLRTLSKENNKNYGSARPPLPLPNFSPLHDNFNNNFFYGNNRNNNFNNNYGINSNSISTYYTDTRY